ncbi:MAG TPA: 3D-(3,5/4)-trihydroxycyclohexane-1,2-dione acylhydrolase (decyclizing) [Burkholderiales bacterium]|nr:3D-(3,5/4)-trihydroxycyclohexane-1,2-dione acylhydrolase (decyclizing) [Burkholderiales bacterium]
MAEALVRFVASQEIDGVPLFAGVWAIFGHGNVAGLGPALHAARRRLPTLRAHNEQAMAHAAIAFAKAHARRRMMACTTSIGPGASNMVTAAAVAHVNRLPVLFLPGDVFASRRPDPVLQQLEHFGDSGASVNDCFRPVSRYFDRITRPEQLLVSLPAALRVLLDPADCGPVTLALPQDVQTELYDYPIEFFRRRMHRIRKPPPDAAEAEAVSKAFRASKRPLVIAGGGVKYALAEKRLADFADAHGLPVAETQAGKGSLAWDHPCNVGAIGVTGAHAANALAVRADLVLAIGTRLGDFATGSRALFATAKLIQLNVGAFDAAKHGALSLVADADAGLESLGQALSGWRAPAAWTDEAARLARAWNGTVERVIAPERGKSAKAGKPTDAQVLGLVNSLLPKNSVVVCAAGGVPGELHKLWRATDSTGYHLEYGYSCMGYEIAGGLGVKLAHPKREVCVLVGDGSYLMLNSEIATSVALGAKLVIVVLDNRGFGCIERLQAATGGASFNNLLGTEAPRVDFAAHARSLGAAAEKVEGLSSLKGALEKALRARKTSVIVIETDPRRGTAEGGAWWDVAVTEVPRTAGQKKARAAYERGRKRQRLGA